MWLPETDLVGGDDWVPPTCTLPLAFAQVREDPLIDAHLLQMIDRPARILMIASGGETAALLSTMSVEHLHLVDINQSQLNLTRLKLHLLQSAETEQRLKLLGYETMPVEDRARELARHLSELGLSSTSLGPVDWLARFGPDYCGRYEWLFARLRQLLAPGRDELERLLSLRDVTAQARQVAPGSKLGSLLESALAEVMDLSRLIQIFGPKATANRVQPFSQHFLAQTRGVLAHMPAADNPFLHQILLGEFSGAMWPWLEAVPRELPDIACMCAAMSDVLAEAPADAYDLVHLSNILDWISPSEAGVVLANAYRCLSPGGLVVIRQLNSQLDIRAVDSSLDWRGELSDQLHRSDRSFFYRALHVGAKK